MKIKVFIDTGAFFSVANKKDHWHKETSNALTSLVNDKASFYTSNFILSETYTLLRFKVSYASAIKFMDEFELSHIRVIHISQDIEERAREIFRQHDDKLFSFVDCTSFALVDAHGFNHALTLDSHFQQYQFEKHVITLPAKG